MIIRKLLQKFSVFYMAISWGQVACIDLISYGAGGVHLLQGKMQLSWVLRVSGCQLAFLGATVTSWHLSFELLRIQ